MSIPAYDITKIKKESLTAPSHHLLQMVIQLVLVLLQKTLNEVRK